MSARRPRRGVSTTASSREKRARVQNLITYHTRERIAMTAWRNLWRKHERRCGDVGAPTSFITRRIEQYTFNWPIIRSAKCSADSPPGQPKTGCSTSCVLFDSRIRRRSATQEESEIHRIKTVQRRSVPHSADYVRNGGILFIN